MIFAYTGANTFALLCGHKLNNYYYKQSIFVFLFISHMHVQELYGTWYV